MSAHRFKSDMLLAAQDTNVNFDFGASNLVGTGTVTITGLTTFGLTQFNSAANFGAGASVATNQTLAVASVDKLTVGTVIVPQAIPMVIPVAASGGARGDFALTATRALKLVSCKLNYQVVSSGACYLSIRKITADGVLANASAGATCIELQTAPTTEFDLTATAATTRSASLLATSAVNFASGDKLGILLSGASTGLVGAALTLNWQCI